MSKIPEDTFDTRVVERNIRDGRITRAQYEAHLKSLSDETPEGEETETRMQAVYETEVTDA